MPVALGLELKNWPFRYIATSPDSPSGANAQLTFGDRLMFASSSTKAAAEQATAEQATAGSLKRRRVRRCDLLS
jgi:hypothetical protein